MWEKCRFLKVSVQVNIWIGWRVCFTEFSFSETDRFLNQALAAYPEKIKSFQPQKIDLFIIQTGFGYSLFQVSESDVQ